MIRSNKSQVVMDKALTVLSNFKLSSGCELEAMKWIDAMWEFPGGLNLFAFVESSEGG